METNSYKRMYDYLERTYEVLYHETLSKCRTLNRESIANDILNSLIEKILSNEDLIEKISLKCKDDKDLYCYLRTIIYRECYLKETKERKRYNLNHSCNELEFFEIHEPESFMLYPNAELTPSSKEMIEIGLDTIYQILDNMKISNRKREIFLHHYSKGIKFKDIEGPESEDKKHRIGTKILSAIKNKIEKIREEGGTFFKKIPL